MGSEQTTRSYMMQLCGDCSYGPPCRCSSDKAITREVLANGRWIWVAACIAEDNRMGKLSAEDRATMFIEWCSLQDMPGWRGLPLGAWDQLVAHIRQGERPFPLTGQISMSNSETTGWRPAETAPRDFTLIEVRYDDTGRGPWSVSCRRGGDGVFRDLEGNPLYLTPDEWRISE